MSAVAVIAFVGLTVVVVALLAFLFRLAMAFRTMNTTLKTVIAELDEITGRAEPVGPAVAELNEKVEELRSTLGRLSGENPK